MTSYEKCVMLKDTVKKLYVDEGRSISYIGRLLSLERQTISRCIKEWKFVQLNQYKGKLEDLLKQYKQLIIARIRSGETNRKICEECRIGQNLFNKLVAYDKDIQEAKKYTVYKSKENCEKIPGEVWKGILGYSRYEVSNMGRVRNSRGMLKQQINIRNGYVYVTLQSDTGKRKNIRVHILVAHAFCDGFSEERNTVNHIDGNKENNKAENLEWVSQQDNNLHSFKCLGRNPSIRRRYGYTIFYKKKYSFKTVVAFARFVGVSETQAGRWVFENPEKHEIEVFYKNKK